MRTTTAEGLEFAQGVLSGESWVPTPLLPASTTGSRLGAELWLKREDCTPIGSFKLRGALTTMAALGDTVPDEGVYVASAGNYGLAIAIAGQRRNVPVTVFVPEGATPSKLERIRLAGARIVVHGSDYDAANEFCYESAKRDGATVWEDALLQEMSHGAGTIGSELLDHPEPWDLIVVPLGGGSLLRGVARAIKARSPETMVVGTAPAAAPAVVQAYRGESWNEGATIESHADGLATRMPILDVVEDLKRIVDEIWLVKEANLLPAVKSLLELEQLVAEPSSAITIAGLAEHSAEVKGKRIAAVITGAYLRMELVPQVMSSDGLF